LFIRTATTNKEIYIDILRLLGGVVSSNRREKWRTNTWFLLQDNAPKHRSVLVKYFLTKKNVTILEQLPYSPDLAPCDFYLLPRLKTALKGRLFCDATGCTENAPEELKRLSENVFQKCSPQLYSHWQKCIVSQGGYFEGNVA